MNGMMPRPLSTRVTLDTMIRMMVCEDKRKEQQHEGLSSPANNDNLLYTTLWYVYQLYEILQMHILTLFRNLGIFAH